MEIGSTSLDKPGRNKDHVSVQIMNDDNYLATSIKQKMDIISLSHYVCRVPEELLKENQEMYYPSLVSVGPFHRGRVRGTDDLKWRYFNTLLSRKLPNSESVLDRCISALKHVERKARMFYRDTVELGSEEFVETLLVDGCFIIELFLECSFRSLRRSDDPVFSTDGTLSRLTCDLILLENQLPFMVLDQLFHLVPIPNQCNMSLIELALYFFRKLIPGYNSSIPPKKFGPEIHHLLDLIRLLYLPTSPQTRPTTAQNSMNHAMQLLRLGIKLKKADNEETPLNIKFSNGELKIPPLKIHSCTEILLRNLIAMELISHPKSCSKTVASYVVLMEQLIKTKRDVRLLHDKNILILDGYGREGEILMLFKKLSVGVDKNVNVEEFYYRGVCGEINGFQARKRRVLCEKMRYFYHRTHLGVVGFCLAVGFLVLVFTAVCISVLAYLLHHFH
ncbi:hypothetical protein Salat_0549400 [Sesamum alatum]|uniref:Uncharacterized protein n=1 Tax=Sesamum alatum TaxID=300844 RepID=A0AAE1YPP0_9LAMI|nr:hypothetical protein Salat_0549400 [Sesamum alatum]